MTWQKWIAGSWTSILVLFWLSFPDEGEVNNITVHCWKLWVLALMWMPLHMPHPRKPCCRLSKDSPTYANSISRWQDIISWASVGPTRNKSVLITNNSTRWIPKHLLRSCVRSLEANLKRVSVAETHLSFESYSEAHESLVFKIGVKARSFSWVLGQSQFYGLHTSDLSHDVWSDHDLKNLDAMPDALSSLSHSSKGILKTWVFSSLQPMKKFN